MKTLKLDFINAKSYIIGIVYIVNVAKFAYCGHLIYVSVYVNDVTGWIYTHKTRQTINKSVLMVIKLKLKNIMAFKMSL